MQALVGVARSSWLHGHATPGSYYAPPTSTTYRVRDALGSHATATSRLDRAWRMQDTQETAQT